MSRRCSNVARIGIPDPVLVRYAGSNADAPSVSYIVCINGRVPEIYEVWYLNGHGVCEVHLTARVKLFDLFDKDTFRSTFYDLRRCRVPFIGHKTFNGSVEFIHYLDVIADSTSDIISTRNIFVHSCGNIRLWFRLLDPTIIFVHMCRLRVRKASTKDVSMSVSASFLSNGKESPLRDIWLWSVMIWVMMSLWIIPFLLSIMLWVCVPPTTAKDPPCPITLSSVTTGFSVKVSVLNGFLLMDDNWWIGLMSTGSSLYTWRSLFPR